MLTQIRAALPSGFERLRAEARAEGFDHIEKLAADWISGVLRFTGPGERLLAAHADGELAGVGGLTIEPALPNTLRLRRFYVRRPFRNTGIGRALASDLVGHAQDLGRDLSLRARTPEARAFWEGQGFAPDARGLGFTHWRGFLQA